MKVKKQLNYAQEQLKDMIKENVDMIEVMISEGVDIDMNSTNGEYKAVCPFHNDHNPSMSINPSKGVYNCFSCGAGGDIFTFIMKTRNVSFSEAISILQQYMDGEDPTEREGASKFFKEYTTCIDKALAETSRICDVLYQKEGAPAQNYIIAAYCTLTNYLTAGFNKFQQKVNEFAAESGCSRHSIKYLLPPEKDELLLEKLKQFEKSFYKRLNQLKFECWKNDYC